MEEVIGGAMNVKRGAVKSDRVQWRAAEAIDDDYEEVIGMEEKHSKQESQESHFRRGQRQRQQ